MTPCIERFDRALGWLSYAVFALFFVFCVWMILAYLKIASPMLLFGGILGVTLVGILSWVNMAWSLWCFVALLPLFSGLYQTGLLPANPFTFWFAAIYLSWFIKRVLWGRKTIISQGMIERAIDVLSALVFLSLIFLLLYLPLDYVGYRLWKCIATNQADPMFCVFGAFIILQGLFFFRVLLLETRGRNIDKMVIPILYVHAVTISIFSVIQWLWNIPHIRQAFVRLNSPFDDIHSYGSYVVLLFFVFLIPAIGESRSKEKILNGCFAASMGALIIMSHSRTTWVAWMIVSGIFVCTKLNLRYRIVLIASALALVVLININSSLLTRFSGNPHVSFLKRVFLAEKYMSGNSLPSRIFLYKRGLSIIQTYPITGSGVGTFYRISPYYDEEPCPYKKWPEGRENAHNYFIQFCADLGIPAFLLFLGIITAAYRIGFQKLSTKRAESSTQNLLKGLMTGLCAYLLTMMVGHPLLLSSQQFLFWFAVAIMAMKPEPKSKKGTGYFFST